MSRSFFIKIFILVQDRETWARCNIILFRFKQELLFFLLLSLGNLVSLFSFLGLLGTNAPQFGVGPGLGDGVVSLEVLQVFCQLQGAWSLSVSLEWHQLAAQLGGLLDVLL